jgi:transposase
MKAIKPTQDEGGVEEVRAAMKVAKEAELYRRLQAILLRMQGEAIEAVCLQVQIHRDTLHAWIRRWNQGGITALRPRKSPGRPRKLNLEIQDLVSREIEGHLADGTPYKAIVLHGHLKKKA